MKRIVALCLCILFAAFCAACGANPQTTEPSQTQASTNPPLETQTPEEAKVLKILTIGNSHSYDATWLLYEAFKDQDPDQELVIGTMYYSGCSIAKHVSFAMGNEPVYEYSVNRDGTWVRNKEYTLQQGLEAEQWDIVVIQEASACQESLFTFNTRGALVSYVNQHLKTPHVFVWNMDIPAPNDEIFYTPDYDPQPPANFRDKMTKAHGFDPANELRLTQELVKKYILPDKTYVNHIPTGTAIMYAHLVEGCTQQELYRDYVHVTDFGRLIAAYTWYAQLTGQPVTEIGIDSIAASLRHRRTQKLGDMEITEEMKQVIIHSVKGAVENPWSVPGQTAG